jgi:hypothetical protein
MTPSGAKSGPTSGHAATADQTPDAHAHCLNDVAIATLQDANMLSAALMLPEGQLIGAVEEVAHRLRTLHDDVTRLAADAEQNGDGPKR